MQPRTRKSGLFGLSAAVIVALLIPAGVVMGSATPDTAQIIQVTATSGGHSATFAEVFAVGSVIEDEYTWALDAPITLNDPNDNAEVAELLELEVTFQADPRIVLGFDTRNSSQTEEMYISVTSARIIFDEIANAQAKAWAQVSVTDMGGTLDDAYVHNAGTFPCDMLYQARYSTGAIVDTADVFASLVSEFETDFGQTFAARLPASGYSDLNQSVYMMQSQFEMVLSAGDRANGLSNFEIVPEPATLWGITTAVGLLLLKQRRRRSA